MNLLDKKKAGWLLWLTPLIFACESEEILSLPQEPGDQTLNLYFKEIPLPFSLVQVDSVNTRRSEQTGYHMLTGSYQDNAFGEVQAQSFTELALGTKAEATAEDNYDSLVLVMVNDYFYGDAALVGSQTVGIYPLADTLERKNYYSTDQANYLPTPLAEFTFTPDPEVASSADTFRIALDDTFGQDLLALVKSGSSSLSTDSAFREYFPGIALRSISGNNFITGFDPNRMSMILYFSTSDETTSTSYSFGTNSSQLMTFNNISVDRSGTPLANITAPNQEMMAADGKFYLQSGTGLNPTLSLQPILDFVETVEDSSSDSSAHLRINRVDLYIGTTPAAEGETLPQTIYAYGFEDDFKIKRDTVQTSFNTFQLMPVGLITDNAQTTNTASPIPSSESIYQVRITNHLLSLLAGVSSLETNFILGPASAGNTINQIVAEPDSIFAKVYYTILE